MNLFTDTLSFVVPCWVVNILLNCLYVLKKYVSRAQRFDVPLDGQIMVGDHRLLGDSTTVLGLVVACTSGTVLSFILHTSVVYGLLIGLGVYFGHALGSFVKRRLGYANGEFMPVVDHADSVLFAGVLCAVAGYHSWFSVLLAVVMTMVLQPAWSYVWYRLGFRKHPL